MQVSMSEFRRRLPELLAKAWAGERLVVVHRPGNQGRVRKFVICREEEKRLSVEDRAISNKGIVSMKKIQSLFKRDYEGNRQVVNELVEGSEWVARGEGVATRKYDGTCCLIENGRLFKRYEVKNGKTPPESFKPANPVDPKTGKQQGWIPVGNGAEDRWHREAFEALKEKADGTYELLGPKVQKNLEHYPNHQLISHANAEVLHDCPRTYDELKKYLSDGNIEGVVWHNADGRMVKIKGKDFGVKRVQYVAK
jgi:hypothetical protein